MFTSLSTVFLISHDLEASRKFYSDVLGLPEENAAADHIRYQVGAVSLIAHAPIPDAEMTAWNLPPVRDPRGAGVVLTLEAEDVDAAHERIAARGADVLFPPRDAPWGVRLFIVRDPSGFLIEVSRPK